MAVTERDAVIAALVRETDHKLLAIWAADCAGRVLHHFEEKYPDDDRPRTAIEAARTWAETGVFKMAAVRGTALAAHAAARASGEDGAARSAARSAGHAIATAHVPTHAIAAGIYAATAVRDTSDPAEAAAATLAERNWQYQHLLDLREHPPPPKYTLDS